uniref:Uncharacterized protein n=1 Tax=Meloidogyne floridensis TaxID=298350 RepID=A0A915NEK9_9BILA
MGKKVLTIKPLFRYPLYFEPKKEIDNGNIEEIKLIKLNIFINSEGKDLIEICLKFKKKGNYLIKLAVPFYFNAYFIFFVKVTENNNEKLISKIFENLTEEEIGIFNEFKEGIDIYVSKTNRNNLNDGELVFEEEEMFYKRKIILELLKLKPLINDGNYFFEMDKEGEIKERIKEINPKNNLIKILKLREIKKVCKNKFKELVYWFLFNGDEYYLMNNCLIAEKLIDEEN